MKTMLLVGLILFVSTGYPANKSCEKKPFRYSIEYQRDKYWLDPVLRTFINNFETWPQEIQARFFNEEHVILRPSAYAIGKRARMRDSLCEDGHDCSPRQIKLLLNCLEHHRSRK